MAGTIQERHRYREFLDVWEKKTKYPNFPDIEEVIHAGNLILEEIKKQR